MESKNSFGFGFRTTLVAAVASLGVAHAQYVTPNVTLSPAAGGLYQSGKDVEATSTTFTDDYGDFITQYAGDQSWVLSGGMSSPIDTLCASYNQHFDPDLSTSFATTAYWLNNATAADASVTLGDGFTTVSLPTEDTSPAGTETGASFLQAAELFGKYDSAAMSAGANAATDMAALQLAVWQTLYTTPSYSNFMAGAGLKFYMLGSAVQTQEAFYTNPSTLSGLSQANLASVEWYDYKDAGGGPPNYGQGQFGLKPGPAPEPVTLALAAGGFVLALRRRNLAPKP